MVDAKAGITDDDLKAIRKIRNSKKPFVLIVNKCDNKNDVIGSAEFYRLGTTTIAPVSALSGLGTGDLLDMVIKQLPKSRTSKKAEDSDVINVAIAGRPNVGKSSLLNSLIKQDRAVVSDIAGTTRDTSNYTFTLNGKKINFIDTAGIRRRGKVGKSAQGANPGKIEKYSVLRSLNALEKAEVVLVLIDAKEGVTAQDLHVLNYALDKKKSIILTINKWDSVEENDITAYLEYLNRKITFLSFAPVIFVSAKTGKNVQKIYDQILSVYNSRFNRIKTSELNSLLLADIFKKSPPAMKNILPKIKYISQVAVNPPTFVFFTNHPELIHFSYHRFLENRIREHWDFTGTPINILFKQKSG
jgi:GTP-binding protein